MLWDAWIVCDSRHFSLWRPTSLSKLNLKVLSHCHSSFVQLYLVFSLSFHTTLIAFKDGIVFYSKIKTTSEKKIWRRERARAKMRSFEYSWIVVVDVPQWKAKAKFYSGAKHLHKLLFFSSEFRRCWGKSAFETILMPPSETFWNGRLFTGEISDV